MDEPITYTDLSDNTCKTLNISDCSLNEQSIDSQLAHSVREYYYYSGYTGCTGEIGYTGCTGPVGYVGGIYYTITLSETSNYLSNHSTDINPIFNLIRGLTYYFVIHSPGYPFWINRTGQLHHLIAFDNIINNGTDNGTIIFTVPMNAPDILYYNCQYNSSIFGEIHICDFGPTGPTGPTVEIVNYSPTGPTGPVGISDGNVSSTFINVYSVNQQDVLQHSPVIFEIHTHSLGDCIHLPNTSDIFIWRTGYYYVYTNIYHIESCQFSIYKNSTSIVPGSTIGSIVGSSQNSNVCILQITNDDLIMPISYSPTGYACQLELINNTTDGPSVTLYDASGLNYIIPQINASITLFFLHS